MTDARPTWGGWDAAVRDDPFPLFAAIRGTCPVHHVQLADGHEAWLVVSHEAARQALADGRLSKDMVAALADDKDAVAGGLPGPEYSRHMLNVDPPDHARLRRLVARAFVPSRVAALEPSIRRDAEQLLDRLAAAGPGATVDLVAGFAAPLPFRVIGALLGLSEADRDTLHRQFGVLFTPWAGDPPPEAVAASDGIIERLTDIVAAKRRHPADDLVSVLVAGADGDSLTDQEVMSSLFQLVVAGHDTTSSLIGNGVVALLDHPDEMRALVADPARIPDAIEELLRFTAPVPHATFRWTTTDVELGGVPVPAGHQVLVSLGAANRDDAAFPQPDRFDVARADRSHLAFGHGIHFCLGAPLARLEARVAFETLLGRFPDLALAVPRADLAWTHGDGLVLRGLAELPVVLAQPASST